ncbi:LysR family transcriptional regulator [Reyranella sp. MMS21-HV4-11]|uniref:LysR family transcriptional regulator n=1 Tax=Reyranella humidisoli TaxID=2849149 RepID=A0ABS6IQ80_9HYPH|nr:LysR family transcriptional regulator [Reyranella sp. MMS21-HV4-11]MBU8876170.1 LysR family transcriptional regulator [Reyranella sp. MMS21-HV4-11]
MDRIDEFAIFVRIVEEGSLVRAARRLRRSPPAVTRALSALEDRIGTRLIDRTTRRLAPTEAGRALYERARAVVADYEAAASGAREVPVRGLLRIAAPVQFGRRHVAPLAARFLDRNAAIEIELLLNDRNVDLIDEGIDVAVRIGALADSSLTARPVGHVRRQWVASPAYLARHGVPENPSDLASHQALLGTSRGALDWSFAGRRRGAPLHLEGRFRTDDIETRLRAVRDGRGIAQFLSYQVADDLAAGRLVRLLRTFEAAALPVQLLTKGRVHRAPKVDAFLDFAAKRLSALPVLRSD